MTQEADLTPTLTDSQKINLNIISLNTAMNDIKSDVNTLNKVVLLGNGELPLRETVRIHEAFIKDVKYWTRFIGGAIVLQTIAFMVAIGIAISRFLPVLEDLANSMP